MSESNGANTTLSIATSGLADLGPDSECIMPSCSSPMSCFTHDPPQLESQEVESFPT